MIWQGQWLLCHRGYLCSLKSPTCTQEDPSPSFNAIKCFLFRNLHNLRAIFSLSPQNQPPLKPFSAAETAFSWAPTLILSSRHFLQSLRGITAGKNDTDEKSCFFPHSLDLISNTGFSFIQHRHRKQFGKKEEKKNRRLKRKHSCVKWATETIYRLNYL